ncbi:type II pantothenate kinase [Xylariales sp. PMI_506]|nr:type II pantothenate kinase [Xylariales sp. PMI_506]
MSVITDQHLPSSIAAVDQLGIDIGLSSIKLVCSPTQTEAASSAIDAPVSFFTFEASQIEDCLALLCRWAQARQSAADAKPLTIFATGSRASAAWDKIRDIPGVSLQSEDEVHCLVKGIDFLATKVPDEVFTYGGTNDDTNIHFVPSSKVKYPFLLVSIGSGVSFIKVSQDGSYERVGGTSLGGGTVGGLLSLLTNTKRSFDEMVDLAEQGDNATVDKLVGDIYGRDYTGIGLKMTAVASSFGKMFSMRPHNATDTKTEAGAQRESVAEAVPHEASAASQPSRDQPREADICRSVVFAVFNNLGQLAHLHSELHGITDVYFGGSYMQGYHHQVIQTLHISVNFYSKGRKTALFLRHAHALGALGAFLTG